MAHSEACQLYIEEQIKEGLAEGKTPYSIGKDLSAWVEKLFEANIPARTIEQKARRIENATNVASPPTPPNHLEISEKQDNQQVRQQHPGPGRPLKYEKAPPRWSCAMDQASLAIDQLSRIPKDDPKRHDAFAKVIRWINNNP